MRQCKVILSIFVLLTLVVACAPDRYAQSRPNVLLIITDDQGLGDFAFNGNGQLATPTLDQLHAQGISFDRFYVSPVCAPTRASLLTGQHYLRTGVFHVTRGGEKMHPEQVTIAEILQQHAYKTGLFGKWHNGLQYPHDPLGQGFDEFYGFSAGHLSEYFDNYLFHNNQRVPYQGYVADRITDQAINFVQTTQQPFFAMLSFNTPHGPFQAPADKFAKYKAQGLSDLDASIYGMVENIDDNIARVIDALEQQGKRDNTIILFLSDNGPAFVAGQKRYNLGLKGHKGVVDEGGVRSPLIINWPNGQLGAATVNKITQHIDVLPTLLSLLDIEHDPSLFDGKDLSPLIRHPENADWPDRRLFTHRFRISKNSSFDPIHLTPGAVRTQDWLAMAGENQEWQLYNLQNDPNQERNLANQMPDVLSQFKSEYKAWYQAITQAHGTYKTLAIQLGHKQAPVVRLPAHEALIVEGFDYAHGAGWSHDWLLPNALRNEVYWPIEVLKTAKFKLSLKYFNQASGNINLELGTQQQSLQIANLPAFEATNLSTARQYYTNEAPDMTWNTLELGELTLTPNDKRLMLALSMPKYPDSAPLGVFELVLEESTSNSH